MHHDSMGAPFDWKQWLSDRDIPAYYLSIIREHLPEMVFDILRRRGQAEELFVVGLQGAQGSGKSTLSLVLKELLQAFGFRVAVTSLDDYYLSAEQRQKLGKEVHPLLKTRGVPGTHDVELALQTFKSLAAGETTRLPIFDKATDNPCPQQDWPEISEPLDCLLFEGWCVGLPDVLPAHIAKFSEPINTFEADHDIDGVWRNYIAHANKRYQPLYDYIDYLITLKVPNFDCVIKWRWQQEQRLARQLTTQNRTVSVMSESQVERFVRHFERITIVAQQQLPRLANLIIELDTAHGFSNMLYKKRS